jgi:hypothetical protein
MIAFTELFTAPTGRHVLALALATFIDVIVFLLAYASGPFFFGAPELRWIAAAAALDAVGRAGVRARGCCARRRPARRAPRAWTRRRSLRASGSCAWCSWRAAWPRRPCRTASARYLLDAGFHQRLVESLAARGVALQAAGSEASALS